MKRKLVTYAVQARPGWWVIGFAYPPQGQQPESPAYNADERDVVQIAPGAWAMLGREPFEWPSAGPFEWPNGEAAAHVAMQVDGVVELAPPRPEPLVP